MAEALGNGGEWQQLDEKDIEAVPLNVIKNKTDYADLPYSELSEFSDDPDFITDQNEISEKLINGDIFYETNKARLEEIGRSTFDVTDEYFGEINDYLASGQSRESVLVEEYVNHLEMWSDFLTPREHLEKSNEWNICIFNRWHRDNKTSIVYSVDGKSFREMPARPLVSGFFPLLYKNSIYVIGNDNNDELKASSYRFDLEKREWTLFADCCRWNHSGCTHCTKIYILGGCSQDGYLDTVETFDCYSGKWCRERNLFGKRQFCGVATDDSCMYIFGGVKDGNDKLHAIEQYDPRDRVATKINVDMSTVRGGCSAAIIANQLYISDELNGTTEILDKRFLKNSKTTKPKSQSRNFLVTDKNKLYQIQKRYIWEYSAEEDSWEKIAKIDYDAPIAIAYQKP